MLDMMSMPGFLAYYLVVNNLKFCFILYEVAGDINRKVCIYQISIISEPCSLLSV